MVGRGIYNGILEKILEKILEIKKILEKMKKLWGGCGGGSRQPQSLPPPRF